MKSRSKLITVIAIILAISFMYACGNANQSGGTQSPDASAPPANQPTSSPSAPNTAAPGSSAAPSQDITPPPASGAPEAKEYTYDDLVALAGKVTKPVNLRIGMATAGRHYQNFMADKLKEVVEEVSDNVTIEVFPGGQLGSVAQMLEAVLNGSLEGAAFPAAFLSTVAPGVSVIEVPFLFDDQVGSAEQAFRVLNSGTSLDDYLYKKGFVPIAWLRSGDNFLLSASEITKVADFQGKKLRCHTSEFVQNTMKLLGATPTIIENSELILSLQNKTIDGTESDPSFAVTQGLYQVANYYTLTPIRTNQIILILSADLWDGYSPEAQEFIRAANQYVLKEYEYDYYLEIEATAFKTMEDEGVIINRPDAAFVSDMRNLTASVAEDFRNKDADCAAIYDEFMQLIAADSAMYR